MKNRNGSSSKWVYTALVIVASGVATLLAASRVVSEEHRTSGAASITTHPLLRAPTPTAAAVQPRETDTPHESRATTGTDGFFSPLTHAGASNTEVFLMPELAGGLNNQRICLVNAIAIAALRNLTLLLPTALRPFTTAKGSQQIEQKGVSLATYFDVPWMMRRQTGLLSRLRIADRFPSGMAKKKVSLRKTTSRTPVHDVMAAVDKALSADGAGRTAHNYVKAKCQFAVDWAALPPHVITGFFEVVRFAEDTVRKPARKVVAATKGSVYNVVHVRAEADWVILRADGLKKALGDKYSQEKIAQGEIYEAFSTVRSVIMLEKSNATSVWVVAGGTSCSDPTMNSVAETVFLKQTPRVAVELYCVGGAAYDGLVPLSPFNERASGTRERAVSVVSASAVQGVAFSSQLALRQGGMSYVKAGVDQEVAADARVFIGRKESSWSAFVAYTRRNGPRHVPSFLYLPSYERPLKKRVDASDIDVRCFFYPCTVHVPQASLVPFLFGIAVSSKPATDFSCLKEEYAGLRPGVGVAASTSLCGVTPPPLFSVIDARLLQPFPLVVGVSNAAAAMFDGSRTSCAALLIPGYVFEAVATSVVDAASPEYAQRAEAFRVLIVTAEDARNTRDLTTPFPHEIFVVCLFASAECNDLVSSLVRRGVYAHRISADTLK
eukprot:Rhum_TRINITY_DN13371_c0_g1::Rhum_TRINITY_DN13371_c0_g1_i1::g.59512::m.59512